MSNGFLLACATRRDIEFGDIGHEGRISSFGFVYNLDGQESSYCFHSSLIYYNRSKLLGDEVVEGVGGIGLRRVVHVQFEAVSRLVGRVQERGGALAVLAADQDMRRC